MTSSGPDDTFKGAGTSPVSDALRAIARQRANKAQNEALAQGAPLAWFEDLYSGAARDAAMVPWAEAAPRFKLAEWLARHPGHKPGGGCLRAIDVGCGLGDNAAMIARAGYDVTAFDLSPTAVTWARERVASTDIHFQQADIFAMPEAWFGAFDLVHETYNLQALPQEMVADAVRQISRLVAPGGYVLVMARSRNEDEIASGPPWPLAPSQLDGFATAGLKQIEFSEFDDLRSPPIRHIRGVWQAPVSGRPS